jgi:hypothetical protein
MDPGAYHPHDDDEPLGAGIGGALLEQPAAWGHIEYTRQVELGIGIGGANLVKCQMWREMHTAR